MPLFLSLHLQLRFVAKAVATALSYMEGACLQGHVASCNAKDLAYQDLATYKEHLQMPQMLEIK